MSDPCAENKVVVNIFGEDYPITGVTDPSYISLSLIHISEPTTPY